MFVLLLSGLALVQKPAVEARSYLRAHRAADSALVADRALEAREAFARCLELSPENPTVAYGIACAECRAGNEEAALEWLARAAEWGYPDAELALWDADLARLRERERFQQAVDAMRRVPANRDSPALIRIYDDLPTPCVSDAALDPAARFLVVADAEGGVRLVDARTGRDAGAALSLGDPVWRVAFHPDGERLATLTWNGELHLWPVDGGSERRTVRALPPNVEKEFGWRFGALLEFDPTGERLLVAARGRGASLWTAEGKPIRSWEQPFGHYFSVAMAWSPDGECIAAAQGHEVLFFDGRTGARVDPPLRCPAEVDSVAFHPGGGQLATGHDDSRARLWDLETRELLFEDEEVEDVFGPLSVRVLEYSDDGRRLAYSTVTGIYVVVLDTVTRERVWASGHHGGRMGEPADVRWSRDGRRLWFAFRGGVMRVHSVDLERRRLRDLTRGALPRRGARDVLPVAWMHGVGALDTTSGRYLWYRPVLGEGGELVQASTGHFAFDRDHLGGLIVGSDPVDSNRPAPSLAVHAKTLYDPKRVRAARAGIPLAKVELR